MKEKAKKKGEKSKKPHKKKKASSDKDSEKIKSLGIRYGILFILAILGVRVFYFIFEPITIYASYWSLELFFDAFLDGNLIIVNNFFPIEIIGSCVAGSAYLLLTILNLSTPGLSPKKRVYSILFSFAVLLALNILRIFLLANVYIFDFEFFNFLHMFFWYFLSIVFVICTWFLTTRIFNIKEIPFYTDLKHLYNLTSSK